MAEPSVRRSRDDVDEITARSIASRSIFLAELER